MTARKKEKEKNMKDTNHHLSVFLRGYKKIMVMK